MEVLLKAMAQSIPVYYMRVFLLPASTTDELQKMLNSFWWGSKKNGERSLNWFSWERLYVSKKFGGMGY